MTSNYEVSDLFEVGSAGSTIQEKGATDFDELIEPQGVPAEALEDE